MATKRAEYNFAICSNTVSETVGVSVFYRSGPCEVCHTYPRHARGVEMVDGACHVLDLVPKGRGEDGLRYPMEGVGGMIDIELGAAPASRGPQRR